MIKEEKQLQIISPGRMVQCAIFDWDGVVVHSSALHRRSWEILARELKQPLQSDHFERGFGKRNETIIPEILGWTQSSNLIATWGKRKEHIYRELAIKEGIPLAEGTKGFLQCLSERKIPCVIGTSTERENVELAMTQHDLWKYFCGAVCSEDVTEGKPNPEVFLKAAHLLKIPPPRCLVIEDSPYGIMAAQRGGMTSLALTTSHSEEAFKDIQPDLLFPSLAKIDLVQVESIFQ